MTDISNQTGDVPVHPVQTNPRGGHCPQVITLRAYEVYRKVYGEQKAIVSGDCRGGFGLGELVAFLYARSFPENEWRKRVDEAFLGMNLDNVRKT